MLIALLILSNLLLLIALLWLGKNYLRQRDRRRGRKSIGSRWKQRSAQALSDLNEEFNGAYWYPWPRRDGFLGRGFFGPHEFMSRPGHSERPPGRVGVRGSLKKPRIKNMTAPLYLSARAGRFGRSTYQDARSGLAGV